MKENSNQTVVANQLSDRQFFLLKTAVILSLFVGIGGQALAGSVAGFGGSTEVTQIANNIQLVISYEQQVQQFVRQGLQYDAQLKNLMRNPGSIMGSDAVNLIRGIGGIMSASQAMGGNLATIDRKFATTFGNSAAQTFSENFSKWNQASKDTLQGSMRAAGMHRDQYASDADALQALYNQSQATNGTLDSLQTLSQINIRQVQQTQALGDLMATQNIASSTYMATQTAKAQARQDQQDALEAAALAAMPAKPVTLDTAPQTFKKWNLYPSK